MIPDAFDVPRWTAAGLLGALVALLAAPAGASSRPPVVFLHGYNTDRATHACLEEAVEEAGYPAINLSWLPEPGTGLDEVAQGLRPRIAHALEGRDFFAVGHSAGSILWRELLEREPGALGATPLGAVLIAAPNRGCGTGVANLGCAFSGPLWRGVACDLRAADPLIEALDPMPALCPYFTIAGAVPGAPAAPGEDTDGDGRRGRSDWVVGADHSPLPGMPHAVLVGREATHFRLTCRPEVAAWLLEALSIWEQGGAVPAWREQETDGPDRVRPYGRGEGPDPPGG